jgi:hypothetical protein
MAAEEKDKKAESTEAPAQTIGQTKILWDDANMRSVYANVANVAGGREEIVLLFGLNQAWHAGQKEVKVQLSDRIVMSPFAAKRLALLLNNVLTDYENKFGKLDLGIQRPDGTSVQ